MGSGSSGRSASRPVSAPAARSVVIGSRRSTPPGSSTTSAALSTRTRPPSGNGGVPKPPGVASRAISLPVAFTRAGATICSATACSASRVRARSAGAGSSAMGRSIARSRNGSPAARTASGMTELTWHRVAALDELPEGRVRTVVAGHKSIALTHYDGKYGALDNHCPHQGGPLGEGSIENGLLRCPWHGFDYCPLDGKSPGFEDEARTYPLEIRDGEVWIGVTEDAHVR